MTSINPSITSSIITPIKPEDKASLVKSAPMPAATSSSPAKSLVEMFSCNSPYQLKALHNLGYDAINECHCIPQFSRSDYEGEKVKDLRQSMEDSLCAKMAEKYPDKDQLITICSIASGSGYQDLVLLAKMRKQGYSKINWILVDPVYSTPAGQKSLEQFKKLASLLCHGINFQVVPTTDDLPKTKLISMPDVFVAMDNDYLGQDTVEKFEAMLTRLDGYEESLHRPIISVVSRKEVESGDFCWERFALAAKIKATITMRYLSPTPANNEQQIDAASGIRYMPIAF